MREFPLDVDPKVREWDDRAKGLNAQQKGGTRGMIKDR